MALRSGSKILSSAENIIINLELWSRTSKIRRTLSTSWTILTLLAHISWSPRAAHTNCCRRTQEDSSCSSLQIWKRGKMRFSWLARRHLRWPHAPCTRSHHSSRGQPLWTWMGATSCKVAASRCWWREPLIMKSRMRSWVASKGSHKPLWCSQIKQCRCGGPIYLK